MTPVIGGISITGVQVYDQTPALDGLYGGCPHVHAVAHELYMIQSGEGWVEFHEPEQGMWQEALKPGDVLQFPPWILHRIVTRSQLSITALLSHAGLAEAGDARIWFGAEVDADEEAYTRAATLPPHAGLEDALARRDRAIDGYQELLQWWEQDRERYRTELRSFMDRHAAAMAARNDLNEKLLQAHPAWGQEGLDRLAALPAMEAGAAPRRWSLEPTQAPRLGMCGLLQCVGAMEAG